MPIALLPNCTKPRTLDNYTNIFNAVTGNTTRNSTHCEVVWIEPETTQLPKWVLNWRNGVVQKKHNNPESSPKRGTNWDLSFYFFPLSLSVVARFVWYFIRFTCVLCSFIPSHSIIYWLCYIFAYCFTNSFCLMNQIGWHLRTVYSALCISFYSFTAAKCWVIFL